MLVPAAMVLPVIEDQHMPNYFIVIGALVCAATSACSNTATGTPPGIAALQDRRHAVLEQLHAATLHPLFQWEREAPPFCGSPMLAKAHTSALMAATLLTPNRDGVDAVAEGGSWILEVADSAKRHGCKDAARDLYDTVIATYTGSAYAALRQRAQIGIDDLRR